MDDALKLLPGQVLDAGGRPRIDYRAVAALAFPFMLNSAVQAVLNATDTWFIGRLSPAATAAIGAVYWPILVCVLLFGGYLRPLDKEGLTVTPLMRSVARVSGTLPKLNAFQFNPFGGPKQLDRNRRHVPRTQDYLLAARVAGKPKDGKSKGVNLVVVADLDMIGNQFFEMRRSLPDTLCLCSGRCSRRPMCRTTTSWSVRSSPCG